MAKRSKAAREVPVITYLETKFQLGVSGGSRESELDAVCAAIRKLLTDVDFVMPSRKGGPTKTVVAEISVKTVIGLQDLEQMCQMKRTMEELVDNPVIMREVEELATDCQVLRKKPRDGDLSKG